MLVCRRVEHHLRAVFPEHEVESWLLPNVSDHRDEVKALEPFLEFEAEVVHRGLTVVEQHELLRAERRELAAELGSDGSRGACHHHGLAAEVLHYRVHVQLYLVAAEKVLDLDLADRRLHDPAVDHLVDAWGHEHLHLRLLAELDKARALGLDRLLLREEYGVNEEPLAEQLQVGVLLEVEDLHTVDVLAAETASEVQVAYHVVVRRVGESGHGSDRLVVHAVDHHVHPLPRCDHLLPEGVIGDDHHHADHQQEHDREAHVHRHEHAVVRVGERKGEDDEPHADGLEERRNADLRELLEGRVADDGAVGLQRKEEDQREDKRQAEPRHAESGGQAVGRQQEPHEHQSANRRREGHQHVDRENELRVEEPVETEPRHEPFDYFHRHNFRLQKESPMADIEDYIKH